MLRRTFCQTAFGAGALCTVPASGLLAQSKGSGAIAAITGGGREVTISQAAANELAESLDGELLLPGGGGYDTARRVWNGMIDRRPALIASCESASDVAHAVRFANDHRLLVAVKGGGHSYPGKSTCDGGLMISLSPMHRVAVDAGARTAAVGGGALLGHLDSATLPHGLATTTGIVSHTGVGGFTLGGGMGYTDRSLGLAIDNLLAADLVTADGETRRVSADENPDLFWAIRGGGGNFGVVTQFVYGLQDFDPTVLDVNATYPFSSARDVLAAYADYTADLPDAVNVEPGLYSDADGNRFIYIHAIFAGDPGDGEKWLAPLEDFARPIEFSAKATPYREVQTNADDYFAHGTLNYLKSGYFPSLTNSAIDAIVEHYEGEYLPDMWFQHLGGAIARVGPTETAYFHRNVHSNFGISGVWTDPSESESRIAMIRRLHAGVAPHMQGYYVNLNEEMQPNVGGNYGANYARLLDIKNRYDPANLFRLNSNIQPSV